MFIPETWQELTLFRFPGPPFRTVVDKSQPPQTESPYANEATDLKPRYFQPYLKHKL